MGRGGGGGAGVRGAVRCRADRRRPAGPCGRRPDRRTRGRAAARSWSTRAHSTPSSTRSRRTGWTAGADGSTARARVWNRDEGLQPARRQADGTYGLIGVTGDDYWSVSQAGRRVPGCSGAVLPDGTCIAIEFPRAPPSFDPHPALVARRGGAVLWSLAEPDLIWSPEFDVAPFVVRDGSGTAYGAYAPETDEGRLVAADAATGGLRARTPGSFTIVGRDGGRRAGPGGQLAGGRGRRRRPAVVHRDRAAVHLPAGGDRRSRARARLRREAGERLAPTAFDTGDGSVLWRSAAAQSVRPFSPRPGRAAPGGTLRAKAGVPRSGLDGLPRWTFRTAGEVVGARELTGRTVVVSTNRGDATGPLWRIDPLRR